ncbi:Endo-1,4-beta-xylanase A precursor [compost metagenome]
MIEKDGMKHPIIRKLAMYSAIVLILFACFGMQPDHSSAQTNSLEVYVDGILVKTISASDLRGSDSLTPAPVYYSTVNNKSGQTRYYSAIGVTLEELLTKPAFGVALKKEDMDNVKIIATDQYVKTFSAQDVFSKRYYYPKGNDPEQAVSVPAMISTSWTGSISSSADKFQTDEALGFFIGQSSSSEKTNSLFVRDISSIRVTTVNKGKSFADIDNLSNKQDILNVAAKGYFSGIEGDRFEPEKEMTRAEFTSILVKSLQITNSGEEKAHFRDINLGDAYYSEVSKAYEQGIVSGNGGNIFAPNTHITREEAITMITRALDKTKKLSMDVTQSDQALLESNYSDHNLISEWARRPVVIALKNRLFPSSDGKIMPQARMTRAETASLFAQLLKTVHSN